MSSLGRFSILTATAAFFLLVAGALVTSTGSGLSVPDWPLSFGQFFPEMTGGVFFEHGHRMIAGTVGILTVILTAWIWKIEPRRWVCRLGTWASAAVILQALLGGATVILKLPPPISIAHAILAQIFFCLTVALAYFLNQNPIVEASFTENAANLLSGGSTLLLFVQIVLGAALRHLGGSLFLYLHASVAGIVVLANVVLFMILKKSHPDSEGLIRLTRLILSLFAIQIVLGLFSGFPMIIPFDLGWALRTGIVTAHVAMGALTLAASLLIALKSFIRVRHARETCPRMSQSGGGHPSKETGIDSRASRGNDRYEAVA